MLLSKGIISKFFSEENIFKSKLIRNSISNIEEQLIVFKKVKRCHRSYLVNLDKVEKMTGNTRNLNLHISNMNFSIPVSRSFPNEIFNKETKQYEGGYYPEREDYLTDKNGSLIKDDNGDPIKDPSSSQEFLQKNLRFSIKSSRTIAFFTFLQKKAISHQVFC